jgi:hypothetical protein
MSSRDEAQRRRVDAVAQAAAVARAVVEDVAEVAVAAAERTSVRTMPCDASRSSLTCAGAIGLVKLGQPQPDSNLSDERTAARPRRCRRRCRARVVEQRAGAGRLGAALLRDAVLLARQRGDRFGVFR